MAILTGIASVVEPAAVSVSPLRAVARLDKERTTVTENTPVALTVAFTEAWSSGDLGAADTFIADDIVFESPMAQLSGKGPYLEAVGQFAQLVSEVTVLAVVGEGNETIIMYDMKTGPFGTLRAAEYFVFDGEKIKSDKLVFDTYEVRGAQG